MGTTGRIAVWTTSTAATVWPATTTVPAAIQWRRRVDEKRIRYARWQSIGKHRSAGINQIVWWPRAQNVPKTSNRLYRQGQRRQDQFRRIQGDTETIRQRENSGHEINSTRQGEERQARVHT